MLLPIVDTQFISIGIQRKFNCYLNDKKQRYLNLILKRNEYLVVSSLVF